MIPFIRRDEIIITDNLIKFLHRSVEFDKNEVLEFIRYGFDEQNYVPKVKMYKKSFYIKISYSYYVAYIYLSLDNVLKYEINFWDLINEFNFVGDKINNDSKYFCLVKRFDIKNILNGKIFNKHFFFDKEKEIFIYTINNYCDEIVEFKFSKKEFYDFYFKKKNYERNYVFHKNYWYNKVKIWTEYDLIIHKYKYDYMSYSGYIHISHIKDIIEKYRTYIMYNFHYKKLIDLFNNRLDRYLTDNIFKFILGISLLKNN